jgi:hypothetical protein
MIETMTKNEVLRLSGYLLLNCLKSSYVESINAEEVNIYALHVISTVAKDRIQKKKTTTSW